MRFDSFGRREGFDRFSGLDNVRYNIYRKRQGGSISVVADVREMNPTMRRWLINQADELIPF